MKQVENRRKKIILLIYTMIIIVFLAVFSYDIYKFFAIIVEDKNLQNGVSYLKIIDTKGMILFSSIQFLQIIFGIFPSEFVQITSMVVFEPWIGFLLCYLGSFLGCLVVYFIVKYSKSRYFEKRHQKVIEILDVKTSHSKSLTSKIFHMYTYPFIPLGAVSYYYAHKNVGFLKYCLITLISLIPSVFISLVVAIIIRLSYAISLGLMIFIVITLLLVIIIKNYIYLLYGSFVLGKVLKPNRVLFRLSRFILTSYYNKKNNVEYDLDALKNMKPPFMVICNHPSNLDFIYASYALKPYMFNTVVSKKYFYERKLRNVLLALGCIPIDLFASDLMAAKSIKKVIRNKGIVLVMPEGRVSTLGRRERIIKPLGKLIKNMDVDVLQIKIEGAYYTSGKFFKKHRNGKIQVTAEQIIDKEQLNTMDINQIDYKIQEEMYYDDSLFVKKNPDLFYETQDVSKDLDNILFICPICKSHYTLITNKNIIRCTQCNYNATVNKRYEIFSLDDESINIDNLPKFYDFQYEEMKKIVFKKNFYFQEKVSIKVPSKSKKYLVDIGEGVCSIDMNNLIITGKFYDGVNKIVIPIPEMPTLIFGNKNEFHLYYNKKFYYLKSLENPKSGIKWSFISEVLYDYIEKQKIK